MHCLAQRARRRVEQVTGWSSLVAPQCTRLPRAASSLLWLLLLLWLLARVPWLLLLLC